METPHPTDEEQALEILFQMAQALTSTDPRLGQIILPARVQQEARSRVEMAAEGVIALDEQAIVVGFNEAAERIFGVAARDVIGKDASALLVTREGGPALSILAARPGARPELRISPGVLARMRGAAVPLQIRVNEVVLAGERRFLLSVQDLLDEHEAPALRTEARYRALVEQIPAVTFLAALDEGQNEMYVSPQIEALLGFSQREWLDDPILWFKQLHPDDQALWNREFARGIATGGPFRAECRVFTRDRRVVWIHGEARLVRDDAGRPLFLQGIAFDITESKRAAEQMREAQEVKLRNERLAAVGRLAASVGHDIRSPLAAIGNAFYYVKKRLAGTELAADPRIEQVMAVIENELRVASRIVGELLDYARERPPARVACPLSPLVAEAMSVVQAPSHVMLENEISDSLPVPDLDRDQFRQVLSNLVQNAAEAIPVGRRGRVRVTARVDDDETVIEVSDNGEGIPEEELEKIFEPLYTSKRKGTGLGLSIVQNAVRRHGGTMSVQSQRGKGTTFTVRVPRRAGDPEGEF